MSGRRGSRSSSSPPSSSSSSSSFSSSKSFTKTAEMVCQDTSDICSSAHPTLSPAFPSSSSASSSFSSTSSVWTAEHVMSGRRGSGGRQSRNFNSFIRSLIGWWRQGQVLSSSFLLLSSNPCHQKLNFA